MRASRFSCVNEGAEIETINGGIGPRHNTDECYEVQLLVPLQNCSGTNKSPSLRLRVIAVCLIFRIGASGR